MDEEQAEQNQSNRQSKQSHTHATDRQSDACLAFLTLGRLVVSYHDVLFKICKNVNINKCRTPEVRNRKPSIVVLLPVNLSLLVCLRLSLNYPLFLVFAKRVVK